MAQGRRGRNDDGRARKRDGRSNASIGTVQLCFSPGRFFDRVDRGD